MADQTAEPVTQQNQETVTKQKNPLRIEQGRKLVEYNRRKKEELKRLNDRITKQDGIEHKPKPNTNVYAYAGGLSVLGLAIGVYLLYNKFKKPERKLMTFHLLLCQRLTLNPKEIFSKCFKNFYHIIYKWLKTIRKI